MADAEANAATGGDAPDPELYVAIVSLVIALVALLGTVLQVLQQYYASATGFSNCDERVMGKWSNSKKRVFRLKELRFEVQFETPVIFVCRAMNQNGPIKEKPIEHISGTEESQQRTRTNPPEPPTGETRSGLGATSASLVQIPSLGYLDERVRNSTRTNTNLSVSAKPESAKRIHTADNEKATWVHLLTEFQRMELDSSKWIQAEHKWHAEKNQLGERQEPPFHQRELVVALQAKPRSWDTMPSNIKKPYATSTMCHIVEISSMLGLHWKEFDRSKDKYRAEGNGYLLTGSQVPDLGIMFIFQIYGKHSFRDSRIVPSELVKVFSFGIVPTIYCKAKRMPVDFVTEEPEDLEYLLLGSLNEFAETVASFGCNTRTADILRDDKKKHGHLFPIAFEIMGMLSKTPHISGLPFRVVPNPTVYTWDKRFFDLRRLLNEFHRSIDKEDQMSMGSSPVSAHIRELRKYTERVTESLKTQWEDWKKEKDEGRKPDRNEHHLTFDSCDELQAAIQWCDDFLGMPHNRECVKVVLREHIQEVLRIVNDEEKVAVSEKEAFVEYEAKQASMHAHNGGGRTHSGVVQLSAASPEQRHKVFMKIYFREVLPRVVQRARLGLKRTETLLHIRTDSINEASPVSPIPPTTRNLMESPFQQQSAETLDPRSVSEIRSSDVWCTLVFRMLCWLRLHDFHKDDRQISSKSELCGSRLPVYIG
ncbi:modin [Pyricularia oryzae 70-15]|uniref:Modin n=1 Tax=Pyricularia oryzae (strain 70-15 / ATCC MYA-4617 / FGSC 8958) TaxID=242507 RepID=G4N488_PYRO7|nr:modin [Pyricularia oryzae 70-15]EHA51956.1 modin [Pyricularia oryzae 70-15]